MLPSQLRAKTGQKDTVKKRQIKGLLESKKNNVGNHAFFRDN